MIFHILGAYVTTKINAGHAQCNVRSSVYGQIMYMSAFATGIRVYIYIHYTCLVMTHYTVSTCYSDSTVIMMCTKLYLVLTISTDSLSLSLSHTHTHTHTHTHITAYVALWTQLIR